MRIIVGILSTFIVLTGAVLTILSLWGVAPFSLALLLKAGGTMLIVCVTVLLVYLFYMIFFKSHDYNNKIN